MNRPLRFCMITTFYPPYNFGGDGVFVRALSRELAASGHHVEVIHCKDSYRLLARRDPPADPEEDGRILVHGLESRFGWLSPLATQQTGRPLFKRSAIERVLDRGFDVIHYHNVSLVGGPRVLEMGNAVKLYTPHEFWLVCPTHVLLKDNREPCERPSCLLCTLRHRRPPQWWRYSKALMSAVRHVDRFLVPSRFSIEMHQARGLEAPMVHLPSFLPGMASSVGGGGDSARPVGAEPYFLFVGRLEKLKGLETIIPLFRDSRRARLVVAGSGSYEATLRAMARGADNILFLGHVRRDELHSLYAGATAVIVPSICYEVSALVVAEAFAHGIPVIARGIGGLAENVEKSGGGITFDDEPSLIQAVQQLLADSDLRAELGRRAYQEYLRSWTPQAYLARYFEIIEEVSASRRGKALDGRASGVGQASLPPGGAP
jgi:glycosyltransferase involved in cell wall biosynthesis